MGINQNRKWLIICMAVLCAVSLSASIFLLIIKLDEPVFLENHCEYTWMNYEEDVYRFMHQEFTIQYLSNTDDTRMVAGIDFSDIDESNVEFFTSEIAGDYGIYFNSVFENQNTQPTIGQRAGLYMMHTVHVSARYSHDGEAQNAPDLILENAVVHFSDGSSQEVNLGEIRLVFRDWSKKDMWLSQTRSIGDNNGGLTTEMQSNKTVSIVGLRWNPMVESEGLFRIAINGIGAASDELIGMTIEKGQMLTVRTDFPEPDELKDRFTSFSINLLLTVQDSAGMQQEIEVSSFAHTPRLYDTWDILRYAMQ